MFGCFFLVMNWLDVGKAKGVRNVRVKSGGFDS